MPAPTIPAPTPDTLVLRYRGQWAEDIRLSRMGPPFGPRNTWSNLAYAIVGTWLPWTYQDDASAALGVALWVLATGSALYHATKTVWANRLDWIGMCMVFGALAAHGWLPGSAWSPWVMLAMGAAVATYYRVQRWVSADWWMLALGVSASIPVGFSRDLLAAWAVMAVAYGIWHLDRQRSRWVGLWGHALWHLLTAVGIALLFRAQR